MSKDVISEYDRITKRILKCHLDRKDALAAAVLDHQHLQVQTLIHRWNKVSAKTSGRGPCVELQRFAIRTDCLQ